MHSIKDHYHYVFIWRTVVIQVNNPEAHLSVQEGRKNMGRKEWTYVSDYLYWKSTQSIFVQINQ